MKLKIFLLIMFLLGFFVVGVRSVQAEGPVGTCYCDMTSEDEGVTYINDVTPFTESSCEDKELAKVKRVSGIDITTVFSYENCRWVDSSLGICECNWEPVTSESSSDGSGGVLEEIETFSGIVQATPDQCKSGDFEDGGFRYFSCIYTEPPPLGAGCYCDFFDIFDGSPKIISVKTRMPTIPQDQCVETEFYATKISNCEWKGIPPSPTPTPVATPSTPVITEGLASLPTVAGSVSTLSGGGGNTAGSAAAGGVSWVKIENPLSNNVTDFRVILSNLINAGMGILGSVTLLVFVYGGFLWLVSAGSPEKIKKGSQAMLWAVIGLFLVFGSYAIMGIVLQGIGARQQAEQSSGPAEVTKIPASVPLSP